MTLVSVVIPVYNYERFVGEAVQSALAQSCADIEVIVVDDGSTDHTAEVIHGFQDPRVKYLWQPNQGPATARTHGISVARGSYIAILDADDVWLPKKLEQQLEVFSTGSKIGLVYCGIFIASADLKVLSEIKVKSSSNIWRDLLTMRKPLIPGSGSTLLIKKEVFQEVGYFDTQLRSNEVWDFYLRVACRYSFGVVSEPLALYRRHGPSSLRNDMELFDRSTVIILNKVFANPALPKEAMRFRRQCYANYYLMLAPFLLRTRKWRKFSSYFSLSILLNPVNPIYWVRFAAGVLFRRGARFLSILTRALGWRR